MSRYVLSCVAISPGEIVGITIEQGRVQLELLVGAGSGAEGTYRHALAVELPVTALATIQRAMTSNTLERIELGAARYLVLLPRPRGAALLAVVDQAGDRVQRMLRLGRYERRRLAVGIEHARCASGDPSLLDEAYADADRATGAA